MQCTSRIYVRFKNKERWDYLLDTMELTKNGESITLRKILSREISPFAIFANGAFSNEKTLSFELGDFWNENNVRGMVDIIHNSVGADAIIIGESYCYSVYPEVTFEYYSFGGELHEYYRSLGAEKHFDIDPEEVDKWIGATRKKALSDEEKKFIKEVIDFRNKDGEFTEDISGGGYNDEDYLDEDYFDEDYDDEDIE